MNGFQKYFDENYSGDGLFCTGGGEGYYKVKLPPCLSDLQVMVSDLMGIGAKAIDLENGNLMIWINVDRRATTDARAPRMSSLYLTPVLAAVLMVMMFWTSVRNTVEVVLAGE